MSLSPIVVWLADVIGKRTIGQLLARGDRRELTTLRRALTDAQDKVDELNDIERLFNAVYRQRDVLQSRIVSLESENASLRQEIVALKATR